MNPETTFACIRADHGVASELVHVSPVFVRCGPPRRGRHEEQRFARTLRSDARRERRSPAAAVESSVATDLPILFR